MRTGPKSVRALERGLAVIEHLSRAGQSSLAELRAATGLSNATLLRILATLRGRHWVRRALVEGQYELSYSTGRMLRDAAHAHPVADLAAATMVDLSKKLGWPSDLAIPVSAGIIEIVESTRRRGPLAPARTAYGIRPSMLLSAHGRAVLAFSAKAEIAAHLEAIERHAAPEERRWLASGCVDQMRAQTKQAGYGIREIGYWAEPLDNGPETGAIACPVMVGGRLFATLSVLWLSRQVPLARFLIEDNIAPLTAAARKIGERLARENLGAPHIVAPLSDDGRKTTGHVSTQRREACRRPRCA